MQASNLAERGAILLFFRVDLVVGNKTLIWSHPGNSKEKHHLEKLHISRFTFVLRTTPVAQTTNITWGNAPLRSICCSGSRWKMECSIHQCKQMRWICPISPLIMFYNGAGSQRMWLWPLTELLSGNNMALQTVLQMTTTTSKRKSQPPTRET